MASPVQTTCSKKRAAAGVAGTCSNPARVAKRGLSVPPAFEERSTPIAYEGEMFLHHRDIKHILRRDWDDFCDGIATDIIGGISEVCKESEIFLGAILQGPDDP